MSSNSDPPSVCSGYPGIIVNARIQFDHEWVHPKADFCSSGSDMNNRDKDSPPILHVGAVAEDPGYRITVR